MSGCDRELNAHFYSAASLKYHVPDTWHDTTSSHIIMTLGNDFGISRPGIEPVTPRSLERTLYLLSSRGRCVKQRKRTSNTQPVLGGSVRWRTESPIGGDGGPGGELNDSVMVLVVLEAT